MNLLMTLDDAPYGTERTDDGLRLAMNGLLKVEEGQITVFVVGDAVGSAKAGQQTPCGYLNAGRMLRCVPGRTGPVLL